MDATDGDFSLRAIPEGVWIRSAMGEVTFVGWSNVADTGPTRGDA
jgi:hypothetical protein